MAYTTIALYLLFALLCVLCSGRVLAYCLCQLLPFVVPAAWGRLRVSLQPLRLLRIQGLELASEKNALKKASLRDACLFREAEWYQTWIRWIFEGSFPISFNGMHLILNLKSLLTALEPHSPSAAAKTVKRRRRKIELPQWLWKLLFKTLSRLLVNISDVQISFEDVGVSLVLENLAVLFKCEKDVPCRAALKAKGISCTLSRPEAPQERFQFFELSEVAATASILCERKSSPELNSLKVSLGTAGVTIRDELVEELVALSRLLPLRGASLAVKSPKKSPKKASKSALPHFLPQKIGGGLHKLTVTYEDVDPFSELNSSLIVSNVHLGIESAPSTERIEIAGGVQKIHLRAGIASDSAEAVMMKLPNTHLEAQLEATQDQISLRGKVNMDCIKVTADDDLIWSFVKTVQDSIREWKSHSDAFTKLDNLTVANPAVEIPERLAEDLPRGFLNDDSGKESTDLDTINEHYLDSGDLGILAEVEEEEPIEGVITEEELISPKPKPPLVMKMAQINWDVGLRVKEGLKLTVLRGSEEKAIVKAHTDKFSIQAGLKAALEGGSFDLSLSAALRSVQLETLLDETVDGEAAMGELLGVKRLSCTVEGSLNLEQGSVSQAVVPVTVEGTVNDVTVPLGLSRAKRLLHLAAGVHEQAKGYLTWPVEASVAPKSPPKKLKSLSIVLQDWKVVATGLQVTYETEMQPVKLHSPAGMPSVPFCLFLELTQIEVGSHQRIMDCHITLQSLSAGWKSQGNTISFLGASQMELWTHKQFSHLALKMKSSAVDVQAEVDLAVLALQILHDVSVLRAEALMLFPAHTPRTAAALATKKPPVLSTSAHVPVRVPSSTRTSMRNVSLDLFATELTVKISIAESDTLMLSLHETSIVAEQATPSIRVQDLTLDMNSQRIAECTAVKLEAKGPCFLTELNKGLKSGSLKRSSRVIEHESSFSLYVDPETPKGQPPQPGIAVGAARDAQMQKWRMAGCSSMGIAQYVEEDYAGTGDVLDFFAIDLTMDRASVIIPYDQHLGRLILFTELWMEAVKDLVKSKLHEMGKSATKGDASGSRKAQREGPADLIEICISANEVVFRLDSHPMEAWLSLHGQPLREAVTLRHAWQSLIRNLQEDFEHKSHAHAATDWVNQAVYSDYRKACLQLQSYQSSPSFHQGAWMCITAANVDALILVGDKKSPSIIASTIERIKELDQPISNDVTFGRVQPIYIAANATNIEGHFSGVGKPSAEVDRVEFGGLIARGRQLTHPPKTFLETYSLGRWHQVQRELPVKGARPPMKVYTDMEAAVLRLDANGGIGLEPVFCELSKAFNRLIPPSQVNRDGSLPSFSGHTLQSWDKIRYTWRGRMIVDIHQLTAAVSANTECYATIQTPRVELQAERLKADVIAGGVLVDATNLEITLFNAGLRAAPEAPLHDLPLCMWPHASIQILYTWLMPLGRSPLLHHAFPVVLTPDPAIQLDPVDLFELFVGEGYTLQIHADFDVEGEASDPVPKVAMGEEQIRFLIKFFQFMEDAPTRIRGCWKKGTYFLKKDKRKKCITPELPSLLHRIKTSLKTSKLAVEHSVWEAEDPSDQLLVTCDDVRFNGTWAFLNKIEEANARREGRFVKRQRYQEVEGVWRQVKGKSQLPDMEDLAVSAQNVEGFLPEMLTSHPILTREAPVEVNDDLLSLLIAAAPMKTQQEDELKPPDGTRGRILAAKTFRLKQQSSGAPRPMTSAEPDELQVLMPNGEIKRPLHIQLADVKVVMPLEVRNAVVGVYMHMLSAFTGPPRSALHKQKIADSIPKEQLQERQKEEIHQPCRHLITSGFYRLPVAVVDGATDSQLLELLMQQDAEGRGPAPEAGKHSSVDEGETVDPLPPGLPILLSCSVSWDYCLGSKMILQMEFENVQLSCLSSVSMGGVLVGLKSGTLLEYFSEDEQIQTMNLHLNQVQAYHMDTKIDPVNPVRWLDHVQGALVIPSDSHGMLTQILQPFEAQLSDLHLMMLAQARNPGRAAEELKIHSSRIEALTDSDQFEMLMDIINSLATPRPPDVRLMRDTILGPTGSALEDTSEAISEAKDMLRETYRSFNDLRQQAYELSLIAAPEVVHPISLEDVSRSQVKEFLREASSSQESALSCRKHIPFVQHVLEEQIEVARKVCYQSTCTLQETSRHVAATNKHKKLYKSMKMQIAIDNVAWKLVNKDTPFMLAEIKRLLFNGFHNKDLSGESSVSIYRIELRDLCDRVGPGSGLDSGVVLSVLDNTGSNEEILRGLAIRGTQTASHVHYDHIEAWVHRFGLNFNEAVAMELASFFFPNTDDEIVRKHEEDWARFGDSRRDVDLDSDTSDRSSPLLAGLMSTRGSLPSFEARPRTASFLEPLLTSTLPDRSRRPSFVDTPLTRPESDPLEMSASATPLQTKKRRKKGLSKPRKLLFVHARFNKIVSHVSYDGRPFSFRGLTITLGMSEYNHLEGNWRGLFKRYRNGIIGSVIKSIATHEGRSYDPSLAIMGDPSRAERSAGSGIFGRGRNLFRRKEKNSLMHSEDEEEEVNVDVLDEKVEQADRDFLLGRK